MKFTTLNLDLTDDGVALATVNRPDKLNALNTQVITDLAALAEHVERTPEVRALIITGAGNKAFVAGADIGELAALKDTEGPQLSRRGQRAFRALEQLGIPVIAAVNGFALGGGCELAMACHMRLASSTAKFGQPEVTLGLIPGYGGTVRLPRLVGRGRATELLLSGRIVDAEEALRIGLVDRVTAPDDLLPATRKLVAKILANGPLAVGLCLRVIDAGLGTSLDAALKLESDAFGEASASEDRIEGTKAFLEKRPAVFHGR